MYLKENENISIFNLSASEKLADAICDYLKIDKKNMKITKFADGEILVEALDSVRGREIYIIQSTNSPVNENLMELLISIDAARRASAAKINVVIPYFGYARQDRKAKGRQPITARLVADLLEKAGADRIITVDIHSLQTMGFFSIPMDNFHTAQTLAEEIIETISKNNIDPSKSILISPDHGGLTRVNKVAKYTNDITSGIGVISKRRPEPNKAVIEFVLGDIENKTCFIIDDMIDTGGTIINAAKALKQNGAKEIYIFACHGLFNGDANIKFENAIKEGYLKEVIVTDTIDIPGNKRFNGLRVISVAGLLGDMISASNSNNSLSDVYKSKEENMSQKVEKILREQKWK